MENRIAAVWRRVGDILTLGGLLSGVGDFRPLAWDPLVGGLTDDWLTRKKQVGTAPEEDRQIVWLLSCILVWQARVAHLWRNELKAELLYRDQWWGTPSSIQPFSSRVNEEQQRRNAQHIAELAVSTHRANANGLWVALVAVYDCEAFWPESAQEALAWVALNLPGPVAASLYKLCDSDEEHARAVAEAAAPQLYRLCPYKERWQAAWQKAKGCPLEVDYDDLRLLWRDESERHGQHYMAGLS